MRCDVWSCPYHLNFGRDGHVQRFDLMLMSVIFAWHLAKTLLLSWQKSSYEKAHDWNESDTRVLDSFTNAPTKVSRD
ncbi:unnamed protein product [Onchocerca flexuosa]|uniref:Neur_chan_LBD domain-containing protein n=1 Tax=Onchocerca flexuosa TaxID=387005 RepID=A0A183HDW3_9BILA|nr:unnamed protein product [Onchocerca flexuosa]